MFKFFRKYNKYLLVVGMSILMIAFLMPIMPLSEHDNTKRTLGRLHGRKVTYGDQTQAQATMDTLGRLNPLFLNSVIGAAEQRGQDSGSRFLRWYLMLEEARSMGLAASNAQVAQVLGALGLIDDKGDQKLQEKAAELKTNKEAIYAAVADWILLQQYQDLVLGRTFVPLERRMYWYSMAAREASMANLYAQYGVIAQAMQAQQAAQAYGAMAEGAPRVSDTLVQHFLHDQTAKARISAVAVPAEHELAKVTLVDQTLVNKLFAEYKDKLPGQGQPFPFGYRRPERVKIEYLEIPAGALRNSPQAQVEEADALKHYQEHKAQYMVEEKPATQPGTTQPATQPAEPKFRQQSYTEVRARILDGLRQQKAREAADHMVQDALKLLNDDLHHDQPKELDGYLVLPPDWKPMKLSDVAAKLADPARYGVQAGVHILDDKFRDRDALAKLEGIGASRLVVSERSAPFVDYLMSDKELNPAADSPFLALNPKLQNQLPSLGLTGADGSRYIFRIMAAEPNRIPESLDDQVDGTPLRQIVEHDAKLVQAFDLLLTSRDAWRRRAEKEPLADLAKELKVPLLTPPAFPKRQFTGAALAVPDIADIGRDAGLVDRVFETADRLAQQVGVTKVGSAPAAERTDAVPVPGKLSLFLVQLDDYEPPTASECQKEAASPLLAAEVSGYLLAGLKPNQNPLSFDAIAKRVGFTYEATGKESKPTDQRPTEPVDD